MQGEIKDFFHNERGELTCYLSSEGLELLEIAWPHDHDPEQIIKNFRKRSKRINYEKLVFITDDDGLSDESYEMFQAVSAFKQVIISSKSCGKDYDFIERLDSDSVRGLQYKRLNGIFRFQEIWNFVEWFNK